MATAIPSAPLTDALAPAGVRVLRGLGQGGMGSVWLVERALHDGLTQRAVLKRPRVDAGADTSSFVARFRNEARALSRVSHGNVVRLLDAGADAQGPWIIIEHVDGLDAHALIERLRARRETLSVDEVAWIAHEASRGMSAAHGLVDGTGEPSPILHRDLSPQNLLLSRAGEVKITDFGIAWAIDRDSRTTTGVVVGNLRYIAPEQLEGRNLSPATDVYGIGRVIEELLDVTADSPSLQGLRAVAQRATRRVADERYDTMDALSEALLDAAPSLCRGRSLLASRVRAATTERDRVHLALGALLAAEHADNDRVSAPPPTAPDPPSPTIAQRASPSTSAVSPLAAPTPPDAPSSSRSLAWSLAGGLVVVLVGFTSLRGVGSTPQHSPERASIAGPSASIAPAITPPASAPPPTPTPIAPHAPEPLALAPPLTTRDEPRRAITRHERPATTAPDASSAETPPAASATLRVSSLPFARVSVDGSAALGTPHEFALTAGSHRVHARFEVDGGVVEVDRDVELRAGETRTLGLTPH